LSDVSFNTPVSLILQKGGGGFYVTGQQHANFQLVSALELMSPSPWGINVALPVFFVC
jgi:hypothetical protein